ncbi:MAG: PQQ-dependent sugar dehydrogenase [Pseudomonadales bacterium]|jgi:glucose/arabinose dehydrogenase
MPRHLATITSALVVVFAACGSAHAYELTTVVEGLDHPWCVAFLPDGALLVTERPGTLRRIGADGSVSEPIAGVPEVYYSERGQAGLFDVLPDPDFAANRTLYLTYAYGDRSANATRVARARLDGDTLTDVEVIFTVAPLKRLPQHFGGKLIFLPDGTLLLTTGEGFNYREEAQNTFSLLGKTVRFNPDGSFPGDNPFADGQAGHPAVWSYGHRNPQGLVLDPLTGTVYEHEHGPRGGDELNVIEPGVNYGWPAITYGMDYTGAYVSPFTEHPGMAQPLKYWVPSIAPSGLAIYHGALFPEWDGSLLLGALVDREVRRLTFSADGTIEEEALFAELESRIRDVRVAPDGSVYLVTDANPGKVVRVHR